MTIVKILFQMVENLTARPKRLRERGTGLRVRLHLVEFSDPWDFEEVYETLFQFARGYPFDTEAEDYLIHITTGTHVAQICLYLLTESHHLPGKLIQCSPERDRTAPGQYKIIDLNLSTYDRIASRFQLEHSEAVSYLKGGIETRNVAFNLFMFHCGSPFDQSPPAAAGASCEAGLLVPSCGRCLRLMDGLKRLSSNVLSVTVTELTAMSSPASSGLIINATKG